MLLFNSRNESREHPPCATTLVYMGGAIIEAGRGMSVFERDLCTYCRFGMRAVGLSVLCMLCMSSVANSVALHTVPAHERHASGREEEPRCGNWQESYSKLHRSIVSGEQPGRYAISVPAPAGLSDRLLGLVTVFLYALLTDRAFQVAGDPTIQSLESVYLQPNINWTISEENMNLWIPGSGQTSGDSWEYLDLLNADRIGGAKGEMLQIFEKEPLANLASDKDKFFIEVNRGRSVWLFDNPYHKAQLEKLGLTYATAFGCSIDYLIAPSPQTLEQILPEMAQIREPDTVTIGIQIRLGDHVLSGGDTSVDFSQPVIAQFFACAQQIQDSLPRLLRRHKVVWLLVTDSSRLREAAAVEYGQKLLTKLDVNIGHSYKQSSDVKEPGQKFSRIDMEALRIAAAEHYLLSMVDAHVITEESSFGRTAAFMARNPEGWLFELSVFQPSASCRLGTDHTPLKVASRHYAGIKHR